MTSAKAERSLGERQLRDLASLHSRSNRLKKCLNRQATQAMHCAVKEWFWDWTTAWARSEGTQVYS